MSGLFLRARLAARGFDIEVDVPGGQVLAVLGSNGSGKSTAMHIVAGLIRPDDALVRVGERVLTDTRAGIRVPTHARRVGLLLQDPLLFPHLSVAANVAFALRHRHRGRARATALRWLAEVDAEELAGRKPRELSGGQAQRVAIARALAGQPDVLLLDEPMAGLDVAAAASVRGVLRRVLARDDRCAILVTHDILDVVTLADRVLVLDAGRVAEIGRTSDVLSAPRSAFGARIAGVNLVGGVAEPGGVLRTATGQRWYGVPAQPLATGERAVAIFAPGSVAVFTEPPKGSPRNVIELTVAEVDAGGTAIRLRAEPTAPGLPGIAADLTAEAVADLCLAPGSRAWFTVKAQEVALHPADRGLPTG